ncbi:MAG: hypothetical protein D3925_01740 [Candidatus Electrothrix sp. AR5]|nr:hypothetical protein [Candidatus Electrothrix sp. AR5]
MISKVKWKTEISCAPDYLNAFSQHGVRSSVACGGEPADIRSRKAVDDRTGSVLQTIFLNDDSCLHFFASILWINNGL